MITTSISFYFTVIILTPFQVQSAFRKLNDTENDLLKQICGRAKNFESINFKLIGPDARVGDFPWAAYVLSEVIVTKVYDGVSTDYEKPSECSGTLISKRHVLTAAHCFYKSIQYYDKDRNLFNDTYLDTSPHDLRSWPQIGLGGVTIDQKDPASLIRVYNARQIWFESDAKQLKFGHDIAIVELSRDVPESDLESGRIVPICMSFDLMKGMKLKGTLTTAAFGEPNGGKLTYNTEIHTEVCPGRFSHCHCPLCECQQKDVTKDGAITQQGDSGAGFYLYEDKMPSRAHLWSILTRRNNKTGMMHGVGVLAAHDRPGNIMEQAKRLINLSY